MPSVRPRRLSLADFTVTALDCALLGLACVAAYWLGTHALAHLRAVPLADDQIGGIWTVIATVFVCRFSYHQSMTAAVSRVAGTAVSFVLCTIYLVFLPFHLWALAVLIGASALGAILVGRAEDAITAAITTAVIVGAVAVSAHDAWLQPILRLADTVIGVAVGIAAAWIGLHVIGPRLRRAGRHDQVRQR